jgi:hypothetical protein
VRERHAPYGVALCLLLLLVIAIRNAWDLITWLAPRQRILQAADEEPAHRDP